ncbi:MAG: cytochrome P450 [Hyphomonadaceae bacterium]|nr:cytochrome P450 [Hyphomonadaceae bacterium]
MANGFIPQTIVPPRAPLRNFAFFAAAARNVLEVLDKGIFETRLRVVDFAGRRSVAVMDPALIEQVLLDDASLYKRGNVQQRIFEPVFPKGLLTTEGEVWKRQRRAAAPSFRTTALEGLVPVMSRAGVDAGRALAQLTASETTDILPHMTRATFDVIRQTLLGGDHSAASQAELFVAIEEFITYGARLDPVLILGLPRWLPRPGKRRAERAGQAMRAFAKAGLDVRRAQPQPDSQDLLQALLDARDPQTGLGLDEDELVDNILTFIAAGHETTALALTWSLYLLAGVPDIQEAVAAEVSATCGTASVTHGNLPDLQLTERVIKEAMRLYPPAPFIQRTPNTTLTLDGYTIPPGSNVTCMIYVTQRSPLYWDRPAEFDPDRFLPERSQGRHRFAWMPFGGGPHTCIGMRFAMMEAVTILAEIVRRVRVGLVPGHQVIPIQRVTLRPQGGMPLLIKAR